MGHSAEERYKYDAQFKRLVDMNFNFLLECQFSPSEMRDAVMLAVIKYEMTHSRPLIFRKED